MNKKNVFIGLSIFLILVAFVFYITNIKISNNLAKTDNEYVTDIYYTNNKGTQFTKEEYDRFNYFFNRDKVEKIEKIPSYPEDGTDKIYFTNLNGVKFTIDQYNYWMEIFGYNESRINHHITPEILERRTIGEWIKIGEGNFINLDNLEDTFEVYK